MDGRIGQDSPLPWNFFLRKVTKDVEKRSPFGAQRPTCLSVGLSGCPERIPSSPPSVVVQRRHQRQTKKDKRKRYPLLFIFFRGGLLLFLLPQPLLEKDSHRDQRGEGEFFGPDESAKTRRGRGTGREQERGLCCHWLRRNKT